MVQRLSDRLDMFLLQFNPSLIDENRLLENIKAHPYVELAQFNHYLEQRELFPNDNYFDIQWGLHNTGQSGGADDADIDAAEAWELGTSGVTSTGDSIVVAIIDNGFDIGHEDLWIYKNYLEIPGNGIDDDSNGYIDDVNGWNAWNNNGTIISQVHGTRVAGIAAARGNNGEGIAGVVWNARIMPVIYSTSASVVESIVVAGYAYIHEMRSAYNETEGEKGAFVVSTNASFGVNNGDPANFPVWGAIFDSLGMVGVLHAAATANANVNVDVVGDVPTGLTSDFLISVTNTDKNDVKYSSAAYGPVSIDLGAPGTAIYSTSPNDEYGSGSGTSYASPHVAGAIAYMYSIAPAEFMNAYHNDPAGMALVVKQYLLDGTDPLPSLEGITVTGGRLNIFNSANLMLNPEIVFNPLSLLQVLEPNEEDSQTLTFTNNSNSAITYSFDFIESTWFDLSGSVTGNLPPFGSGNVTAHFNSTGLPLDTLFLYLSFNYGSGKLSQIPVHLFVQNPVSADEEKWGRGEVGNIVIWPNPASEMLNVEGLSLNEGQDYKMAIINSSGALMKEIALSSSRENLQVKVDTYPEGVYFAILKKGNACILSKKFVVIK
jgi:subtilisin family serine protease